MAVGKLQRVELKEVWAHEEQDFTPWLKDNIDVLGDALKVKLESIGNEVSVGSFSADLMARDGNGRIFVIENQLTKSDHDHLGKLLTYMVGLEARAAIWIVSAVRPEHAAVINRLNKSSEGDYYLVVLEAVRIGGSEPAPLLTLIAGPTPETKAYGVTISEIAEQEKRFISFWTGFLERMNAKSPLFRNISPSKGYWMGCTYGRSGVTLNAVLLKERARVELYIYIDSETGLPNKRFFDELHNHRVEVEKTFGAPLVWERLESSRASRISAVLKGGGYGSEVEKWQVLQDALVDLTIKFEAALNPLKKQMSEIDLSQPE